MAIKCLKCLGQVEEKQHWKSAALKYQQNLLHQTWQYKTVFLQYFKSRPHLQENTDNYIESGDAA